MAKNKIDWGAILAQLVAAVVPGIIKLILGWFNSLNDQKAIIVGRKIGKIAKGYREA